MAVPLEKFVQQIEDCGIIDAEALKEFLPPKADPKSAEELALVLVRNKKLTKFQAEEVSKGKGKSLILGNYVLMERIGAGGMGQVFKARHRIMDRMVAVKVLSNALTKDQAALSRFQREVKAAAKLNHPNIVTAYDADQASGVHFLVMELVEGSDLSALVKKNGPYPVDRAVNFILQAAKGLEAAHKKGIVHRDIKPANLLLDSEGTVKILDMGLARIHGDGAQAELTHTGAVMGTVDYMAPEQAENTKSADARADIYALGCSLYYLLTAHATYDGDTLMAKLLAHRDKPIPSLRASRPEVTEGLEAVFRKMIAKNIDDRYQTIGEVISDLESCSNGSTNGSREKTIASRTVNISLSKEMAARSNVAATQQFSNSLVDTSPTEHLEKFPAGSKLSRAKKAKGLKAGILNDQKKLMMIGGALFGVVALLAVVVITLRGDDADLIVTVNEPDAEINVLRADDTIEVKRNSETIPIKISITPGKHRVKVEKDGFEIFVSESFEIKSGKSGSISAKLVPLDNTAVAGNKPWGSPEFKQWMQSVAALSAERQIEAVSKKLTELNPGFDGKFVPSNLPIIHEGKVTGLQLATDKVTDLSPIRALSDLVELDFISLPNATAPLDLSPLHGMKLRGLRCGVPRIDVSTLKGLKVTHLGIYGGGITDLSPISGMPLQSLAIVGNWNLTSLEPLKGMQLTHLSCDNCQVADLSPLRGMPLKGLVCHVTQVADLSPLKGMPLEELSCFQTLITDLSPLAGMKLKRLTFTPTPELKGVQAIRQMDSLAEIGTEEGKFIPSKEFWKQYDAGAFGTPSFKPLTDVNSPEFQKWTKDVQSLGAEDKLVAVSKKLAELNPGFDGKLWDPEDQSKSAVVQDGKVFSIALFVDNVADLSPIRALLEIDHMACVSSERNSWKQKERPPLNLSPLSGMKIRSLYSNVHHFDLSSVKGLQLTEFAYYGAGLTELAPITGMRLQGLSLSGSWEVKSLEPLNGMPLSWLACDNCQIADLSPLHGMPLKELVCFVTKAADLSPLKGMPLEALHCEETLVTDLLPLAGLKLKKLSFTPTPGMKGLQAIRTMDSLTEIGPSIYKLMPSKEFWKQYDAGAFGAPGNSKPSTDVNSPEFQKWMKEVQALRPEDQAVAVGRKLVELNPGFDGKVNDAFSDFPPPVKDGFVTAIRFSTDNVTDVAPVRALSGLEVLSCRGSSQGQGKLRDLSPLKGLKLGRFDCTYNSNLSDLSPLRGMPLRALSMVATQVTDLSPLQGMPLVDLWISETEVSDLSPLKGLPLTDLMMWGSKVTDLSPLKETKLTQLNIAGTPISDLTPLKGMSLGHLTFNFTQVSDVSPLRGMPLDFLRMEGSGVTDLSPLEGMNLSTFSFTPQNITKGINIIRQMKSLKEIGGASSGERVSRDDFWKKYEAGEFGKPQ